MRKEQEHQAVNNDKGQSPVTSSPGNLDLADLHATQRVNAGQLTKKFDVSWVGWVGPFAVCSRENALAYAVGLEIPSYDSAA